MHRMLGLSMWAMMYTMLLLKATSDVTSPEKLAWKKVMPLPPTITTLSRKDTDLSSCSVGRAGAATANDLRCHKASLSVFGNREGIQKVPKVTSNSYLRKSQSRNVLPQLGPGQISRVPWCEGVNAVPLSADP